MHKLTVFDSVCENSGRRVEVHTIDIAVLHKTILLPTSYPQLYFYLHIPTLMICIIDFILVLSQCPPECLYIYIKNIWIYIVLVIASVFKFLVHVRPDYVAVVVYKSVWLFAFHLDFKLIAYLRSRSKPDGRRMCYLGALVHPRCM